MKIKELLDKWIRYYIDKDIQITISEIQESDDFKEKINQFEKMEIKNAKENKT